MAWGAKVRSGNLGVGLVMWVVYRSPKDFPGVFVARKWLIDGATQETVQAITLEGVRALIPQGLHRMARDVSDDPCIVETWL